MYGERFRELRTSKGLNQAEMADILGLKGKASTYRAYELEYNEPGLSVLITMADYFGVTIDYLIGRTDETNRAPIPSEELVIPAMLRGPYRQLIKVINELTQDSDAFPERAIKLLLDMVPNLHELYKGEWDPILDGKFHAGFLPDDFLEQRVILIDPLEYEIMEMIALHYKKRINQALDAQKAGDLNG